MQIETIGAATLYLADCRDVLPTLGKVDAVVTSPPYDDLREYGEGFEPLDCGPVISALSDLVKQGGVIVWNVADATIEGSESCTSFRHALHAVNCGLKLHDTMIYEKAQAFGGSAYAYLHSFEYMFVFSKGRPATFNAIRDRKNIRPGLQSAPKAGRGRDGILPERHQVETLEFGKRTNIWRYGVGGENFDHPAVMPFKMAQDHVFTWSNEGDAVLDPFLGSGTTGVAAVQMGRKFIGIEMDAGYFDIACRRIEQVQRQADMFIQPAVAIV